MRIFIKILPYLIIVMLGVTIYAGFRYMSSELEKAKERNICLTTENAELLNRVETLEETNTTTINQLLELQNNEHKSLEYINKTNDYIDNYVIDNDRKQLLLKINTYEECMSKNSLEPSIKCTIDIR